ncbi:uncharacterized protein [Arachis hypogaea]|uniref:uncharacterized protein n=1 Tax=Arachis hypogaea TaxID=3818 RepID=UPI003B2130EF
MSQEENLTLNKICNRGLKKKVKKNGEVKTGKSAPRQGDPSAEVNGEDEAEKVNEKEDRDDENKDIDDEEITIKKMPNGLLNLIIGESIQKEIREEWWNSLIVKLLGRKISLLALKRRLETMWAKMGSIEVIDLGVGRILKVDSNTAKVSRKKFTRICVKVELDKPLVSQYLINGIPHAVEYEGLHLVCFSCGRVGHDRENCLEKKKNASESQNDNGKNTARNPEVEERDKNVKNKIDKGKKVQQKNDGDFGPWMLVQRHARGKKFTNYGESTSKGGNVQEKGQNVGGNGKQSHFAVLQIEESFNDEVHKEASPQYSACNPTPSKEPPDPVPPGFVSVDSRELSMVMKDVENREIVIAEVAMEEHPSLEDEMILAWNIRGVANYASVSTLKELVRQKHPDLVLLCETECSGARAKEIIRSMGFKYYCIHEAQGYSGGIWALWNCDSLQVYLEGGQRNGLERVFKRLDRALANADWRSSFSDARVEVLPRVRSDHHPLLVIIKPERMDKGEKRFRYEAMWKSHPNFDEFVLKNWSPSNSFPASLNSLAVNLKKWNNDVFGNVFKRKRRVLNRINGIQKASTYGRNPFLEDLEQQLVTELEEILNQEEILWLQKSRQNWIVDGDRNTRYYHTKTAIRKKKNRILKL